MKIERWLQIHLLGLFVTCFWGCGPGFQAGGDVAQGRQAMLRRDYPSALGYFQSAVQADPNYVFGTELRTGTLSYLGRAQYLNGQLGPARDTLQRALTAHQSDHLARLYLGLTLARQGDQQGGLRDIQTGTKGIGEFVSYITNTFSSSFGQFWDPNRDIRKAVDNNLALMARGNIDWPTLISSSETLAVNFEQEPDRARQQEEQQIEMDRRR